MALMLAAVSMLAVTGMASAAGLSAEDETVLQSETGLSEPESEAETFDAGETVAEESTGSETETEMKTSQETSQETDMAPESFPETETEAAALESAEETELFYADEFFKSGDIYCRASGPGDGRRLMASKGSGTADMHYYFYLVNHDLGKIFEDGRVLDHIGMIMLNYDGSWHVAYCVRHNANILNGDDYYTGGSWQARRYQNGVGRALYYGLNHLSYTYTGTDADKNRPGSEEGAQYTATQTAIWLMETGWFWDDPAKANAKAREICRWARDNQNGKAGKDGAMGDYAWNYYQRLRDLILADEKMPSFTRASRDEAAAAVTDLNYENGIYRAVFKDKNNVYGSCSISGLPSGVQASYANGNLTLTSSAPFDTTAVTVTRRAPAYETAAVLWHQKDTSRQNVTTYQTPQMNDQTAYFAVRAAQVNGSLQLKKISAKPAVTDGLDAYQLEGAVYGVYSDEALSAEAGRLTTDQDGLSNVLSLEEGSYWVKELTAPKGYRLDTKVYEVFVKAGETVMAGDDGTVKDLPETGVFRLHKKDQTTGRAMSDITFKISHKASGRQYLITTDPAGSYDSAKEGKTKDLPTGEYTYEELRSDANFGKTLVSGTFTLRAGDTAEIDVTDQDYIFGTMAVDTLSGLHELQAAAGSSLTDTVSYRGLTVGETYTLEGTLMDAETGKPFAAKDNKAVTATASFKPEKADGQAQVIFEFDASACAGKTLVVFEKLKLEGEVIAVHEDLKDQDQTVTFPEIKTNASDAETGTHHARAAKEVHLTDTVTYKHLIPGKTYQVKGVLMDKATGEAVKDGAGREVTASTELKSKKADGCVTLDFIFDGSLLAGHETVVFETLYYEGKELAVHADLEDEDQTVRFPEIGTIAEDAETGTHYACASAEVHLKDTVTYRHLIPGKGYMVSGMLMDKITGQPICDAAGNQITAQTMFLPETPEGSVTLDFVFDGSALDGHTVVAFETLYYEDKELAVHADLEDVDQTIIFPMIHTTAVDRTTQSHEATAAKHCEIIDTVDYSGLKTGQEYVIKGTLMDKTTGKPVTSGGRPVTAETSFIPDAETGSIQVRFIFDGIASADMKTVVFESLYAEDHLLAVHEDIEDKGQTVIYRQPPTPETSRVFLETPATGDGFPLGPAVAACIACAGALFSMAAVHLKDRKKRPGK